MPVVQPAVQLVQRRESFQIAFDEIVVPAADRKHGHAHAARCSRERSDPSRTNHRSDDSRWSGKTRASGAWRSDRRSAAEGGKCSPRISAWRFRAPSDSRDIHNKRCPSFMAPPARIIAVEIFVRSGNHRKDRLQMRIVQQRHAPLRDPQVRAADHADFAVRPGLRRDPVQACRSRPGLPGSETLNTPSEP